MRISRHLTKRELLDVLNLVHQALMVKTDEALRRLLLDVQNVVPCTHTVSGLGRISLRDPTQGIVKLVNASYPAEWLTLYLKQGYGAVDPVLRSLARGFQTQIWSEAFPRAASPRERAFLEHARAFGLSHGVTLGVPSRRHAVGSLFSFAGRSVLEHARHVAVLEHVVPHLHIALMRTAFPPPQKIPALSAREREVLKWMKEGKTNWEISQILRISERTVKFHVQNVFMKLGASTRAHAVALAMDCGLIAL